MGKSVTAVVLVLDVPGIRSYPPAGSDSTGRLPGRTNFAILEVHSSFVGECEIGNNSRGGVARGSHRGRVPLQFVSSQDVDIPL